MAAWAVAASDGRLQLEGPSGSLYGPLQIGRLRWENDNIIVSAEAIDLDWQPGALWRRALVIDALRVGDLAIEKKAGGDARRPSTSAPPRLPVSVLLAQVVIDRVRVDAAGRRYVLTTVEGQAQAQGETVTASVQANAGALRAHGRLALVPEFSHTIDATLDGLDLARISQLPSSDLHGRLMLRGRVSPWVGRIEAALDPSEFNREPVQGKAKLTLDGRRLSDVDLDVSLGRNRVRANGGFGAAGDQLAWRLEAPRLADLGPGFGGRVQASGTAAGDYAAPNVRFDVDARELRLPGNHRLSRLHGEGRLAQTFNVTLRLNGYRRDALRLTQADLAVRGTQADHRITLSAQGDAIDAQARASGALIAGVWRGRVTELSERARLHAHLVAPARVEVARDRFRVQEATVALARGRIVVANLEKRGAAWRSAGRAQDLALSALLRYVPREIPAQTTLVLAGEWNLDLGDTLSGSMAVRRVRGDVTVPGATPWTLGLTRAELRANVEHGATTLAADLAGARAGEITLRAQTQVSRQDGRWGVAASAPLMVDGTAAMSSLAWLGAFTENVSVDGRLQAQVRARGTVGAPQWQGDIRGQKLAVSLPAQGLHWREGSLEARFRGEQLVLKRLHLQGGEGHIEASGTMGLVDRSADIAVSARTLLVSRLPARELVASGDARVTLREKRVQVQGKARLDRGRVELPKRSAPTLSSDIVIVGQEEESVAESRRATFLPQLDVEIDLGDRFYLKANGLDARLTGAVALRVADLRMPRASGSIRSAEGIYTAYGQRLSVERGVLTFNGPLANPALDILALRKNQAVQAGVAVTGTALQPVVKLVSIPSVPDADKLSWLVLGHGIEDSSSAETDVLAQAAAALLARGESVTLQARIAQTAGLDEFRFSGGGGLESAIVTLGKRLSSRVYVTYEAGLSGTTDLFTARYTLSPRWSLQTQYGGEATAVDLFYTFSFD